jgi:hypothetical protein
MRCLLAASAVLASTMAYAEAESAPMRRSPASITPHAKGVTRRNDFPAEAEAIRHCRGKPVVWVIARDRVYFTKSDPEYGTTGEGAFMCEDEARGDRNRAARREGKAPQ